LRFEIRTHKILLDFISKVYYEDKLRKFRPENDSTFNDLNERSPLKRIMKRVFFFDFVYLKELKD
jgi:hypothetical protein